MQRLSSINYSVLDLAVVVSGKTVSDTFSKSVDLARHAEEWGYTRYWFAEHHNMVSVASSATALLIGHVADKTKTIRVGSGGIMLPNHSPLIVAEQFGTLATLYPERIDLGLGRAPGTDQVTAMAIRGDRFNAAHDFPADVRQLQLFLSEENQNAKVRAFPGEGTNVPIWILGSSTDSAYLAAAYGLPYAFACHFAPQQFMQAVSIYKANFRPSAQLQHPYVMACVHAVVSETDQHAEYLSTSLKQMFRGVITGKRELLPAPVSNMDDVWSAEEEFAVNQMLALSFIGSKDKVEKKLGDFVRESGIDELMVTSPIFEHQERLKSYSLLANIIKHSN